MNLVIGAPYLRREWIIDDYLDRAAAAAEEAGVSYSFLLLGADNDPTTARIRDRSADFDVTLEILEDETRDRDQRDWGSPADRSRVMRMVYLRNRLLRLARGLAPDFLLSLDTDILLAPDAIASMIDAHMSNGLDAVGGYCYMGSGRNEPSYGDMPNRRFLYRPDIAGKGVQRCLVLMAAKLMTPAVYQRSCYGDHDFGEDIGWSLDAHAKGFTLGIDARVVNKHVMEPEHLHRFDKRCGF